MCIAYDSSGSLSLEDFDTEKNFVAGEDGIIDTIAQGTDGDSARFAVAQFASGTSLVSSLTNDEEAVKDAVQNAAFGGGLTNLNGAIKTCVGQLTSMKRPRVIVLLTDGVPTTGGSEGETIATAQAAKNDDIAIVTVGIGSGFDEGLLKNIASGDPPSFFESSIEGLNGLVTALTNETCKGAMEMLPTSTPEEDLFTPSPDVETPSPEEESPTPEDVTPSPDLLTESPTPEDITESPTPEDITESPTPEDITETPSPEETTESPTPDVTDEPSPEPEPTPLLGPVRFIIE